MYWVVEIKMKGGNRVKEALADYFRTNFESDI